MMLVTWNSLQFYISLKHWTGKLKPKKSLTRLPFPSIKEKIK